MESSQSSLKTLTPLTLRQPRHTLQSTATHAKPCAASQLLAGHHVHGIPPPAENASAWRDVNRLWRRKAACIVEVGSLGGTSQREPQESVAPCSTVRLLASMRSSAPARARCMKHSRTHPLSDMRTAVNVKRPLPTPVCLRPERMPSARLASSAPQSSSGPRLRWQSTAQSPWWGSSGWRKTCRRCRRASAHD
jgi:hypothetical protein